MPEPNMKGQSIKEKSNVVPGNDHVLRLITECRQDTKARPENEICKFCGQVCTSWKKLTDHLAKPHGANNYASLGLGKAI